MAVASAGRWGLVSSFTPPPFARDTLFLGGEIVPYERLSPFVMHGTLFVGRGPHYLLTTTRFPLLSTFANLVRQAITIRSGSRQGRESFP